MKQQKKIVLGVTGSIAAYKSADLVRRLREKEYVITVVMTDGAAQFITPLTLASLSGRPVYHQMFKDEESGEMLHIRLAKEADILLVAPATANIIGRLANGLADDLLTCIALATRAPIVVAPAMNEAMYQHPAVQDNCRKLKERGVKFVDPIEGDLACGDYGKGHLAAIETIVKAIQSLKC